MEYTINLLKNEMKILDRLIRQEDLMHKDLKLATKKLKMISEIKRAIKILKSKM